MPLLNNGQIVLFMHIWNNWKWRSIRLHESNRQSWFRPTHSGRISLGEFQYLSFQSWLVAFYQHEMIFCGRKLRADFLITFHILYNYDIQEIWPFKVHPPRIFRKKNKHINWQSFTGISHSAVSIIGNNRFRIVFAVLSRICPTWVLYPHEFFEFIV